MPKLTLLEMTQNILSAMDGDEVNSISDTVESDQVATVVVETYYDLMSGLSVPSKEGIVLLEAVSDPDRPTYMRIGDNIKSIKWIKYDYLTDGEGDYRDILYLTPEQFLQRMQGNDSHIPCVDPSGATLLVGNEDNPRHWTTFDNEYIIFDSYDPDLDTSLQQSKTLCWGQYDPVFAKVDAAIPDLDVDLFPTLLAEAKASCFINFKQVSNSKEEQRARRGRVKNQNDAWRADQRRPYNRTPDYGRRGPNGTGRTRLRP